MASMFRFIPAYLSLALLAGQDADSGKGIVGIDKLDVQSFQSQPKIALLVGVGSYPETSGFSRIRYPAKDVGVLAAELDKQGYTVRSLVDSEATRGVVRKTLRDLAGAIDKEQGTLLFYFSGHGFEQDGLNYLALYGTVADDLKGEGLALPEVFELIGRAPARRKVVLIDACRNNPLVGRQASGSKSFAAFSQAEGLRVLYSTRPGGLSFEDDSVQQGVFTHFLVRGIRGDAVKDGLVTFGSLAEYVTESVRTFGMRKGQIQVPFQSGEFAGDFLLARSTGSELTSTAAATGAILASAESAAKRGLELVAQQKYSEAVAAFSKAMGARPAVAEEYYFRGISYGHLGEYQRAIDDFTKALELGGDAAEVFGNRGFAYSALQQHDRAKRDFTRAIDLKPDYVAAFVSRGRVYATELDHNRAIVDFSKALELQPNLPLAFRCRAQSRAALQDYDQAIKDFGRAIELDPDAAVGYIERAKVYVEINDSRRALTDYTEAIQRQPRFAAAFEQRARLYMANGDYRKALEDYDRSIEIEPSASAYANRGYGHAALKQYELAITDCGHALELQPDLAEAFNNRGYAHVGLRDFRRAIADFDRAIDLRPDYETAYENRAAARKAVGDTQGAKTDSEKARSLQRARPVRVPTASRAAR